MQKQVLKDSSFDNPGVLAIFILPYTEIPNIKKCSKIVYFGGGGGGG